MIREAPASLKIVDIDGDGEQELILRNEHLYAVLSPARGGRILYLFARAEHGGVLLVGNPTDDWNFQQSLNSYMDLPANHPGALADVGFEHDRYEVFALRATSDYAFAELINVERSSALFGSRKSVLLTADAPALMVRYETLGRLEAFSTRSCLSPDYLRLLREGRGGLRPCGGWCWRGYRNGDAAAWLALSPDEDVLWEEAEAEEAGHGVILRMNAPSGVFHALLGSGQVDEQRCLLLFQRGRLALDQIAKPITEPSKIHLLEVS